MNWELTVIEIEGEITADGNGMVLWMGFLAVS